MTVLRICFAGDSVTHGTGDPECLGWPGRVCAGERAAGHDVTLYNLGVRADTSALVGERWRAECAARLPDVQPGALVFSFGLNDAADQEGSGLRMTMDDSLDTARAVLAQAMAWKPTLWIGPTPVDETQQPFAAGSGIVYRFSNARTADLNAAFAVLAGDLGVPYLDLFTPLAADSRWPGCFAAGDGVHPANGGYAIMAERVAAWPAWRAWFDG